MADWQPHPYQKQIVDHQLTVARGGTWAGMGLGKTVSTLTTIDALQLSGEGPALVLAPLRVAQSTWPDEARKWTHLSGLEVVPIVGDLRSRERALKRDAAVYTINYEQIPWLIEHAMTEGWRWPIVVADESTRLKGFRLRQGTKRARALARVAHARVTRWINLTGTPAPNGVEDLWGQTWFLDKGERLGSTFASFTDRWFAPDRSGYGVSPLPHAQREIEERLADIHITIDKGLDVDAPIVNQIYVNLPKRARELYRAMEREYFAMISASAQIEAANAAVKSGKLLQLANGAVYTDDQGAWAEVHDAKLQALESVIEEASGAPVLVAYHFRSDLARLQKAFPKARVLDAEPQTLRDWNAGRIPILLAHPASAGHGLNLQDGGHILVFFSLSWNLEEHDQIIERIGPVRQKQAGHNRPVFVHYLLAGDTIDNLVLDRLRNKRDIQAVLLEAMRAR
jgi:SNF2 family DNA or RNA helicase